MWRRVWVAAALSLSACAPPGYVYEDGDLLHPHPSAELCASKNLLLDPVSKECVMPPPPAPPAPPPKRRRTPVHAAVPAATPAATAAPAPAAPAATPSPAPATTASTTVPIEPGAVIKDDLRKNTKLLNSLVAFVTENGHPCAAISAAQADVVPRRFTLLCDHARHSYDIEASGPRWVVTVK